MRKAEESSEYGTSSGRDMQGEKALSTELVNSKRDKEII